VIRRGERKRRIFGPEDPPRMEMVKFTAPGESGGLNDLLFG